LPYLPCRFTLFPQAFKQAHVTQRIHALPESIISEGNQLSISGQPFHRFTLKDSFIIIDVVGDLRFEHKEAPVDPSLPNLWFLGKRLHGIAFELDFAIPRGRSYSRDRGQPTMAPMKLEEFRDIDVRNPIAIRQHKRFLTDEFGDALDPAAGLSG